jgi:hypothetical protein
MRKLILILATLATTPAFAEPQTPTTTVRAGLDPNERTCRTVHQVGSRLARTRQCATRAQWVEILAIERRQARDIQRQGNQPQCMSPGERAAAAGRYNALGVTCN